MKYQEAVKYIDHLQMFTKKHTLEHKKEFLKRLGSPQKGYKIIHVAGTNGKGSVCRYMQGILLAEGKKTGMFTSPHLTTIRERIQINGENISEEKFLSVFLEISDIVKKMEADGLSHPTYFEFLFGMAMKAFQTEGMEYVILETGLGGRLDATNSIEKPVLTVITSVGMDHMEILGNSIPEIAKEKAGIIKKDVPLILDVTNREAAEVIRKTAENAGVICREIGENAYEIQEITGKYIAFSTVNRYDDTTEWKIPTVGIYQPQNAVMALESMQLLLKEHRTSWRKVLAETIWPGRMEEVCPGIFLDGAHNMPAIRAATKTIAIQKEQQKKGKVIILFSAVKEKEYREIIRYICQNIRADLFVVTELNSYRAVKKEELKQDFEFYTDKPVIAEKTVWAAWKRILDEKQEDDRVYCFGSLYLVGEIKEFLREVSKC